MGRLNKTLLDPETLLKVEGGLFNSLSRREAGELEGVLRGLLTSAEIEMLAKRVELLKLLAQGATQEMVAHSLKMSSTTISQMRSRLRYDKTLQKFVRDLLTPR
ncbi:MAG TPA: Trp family transcriptional regulator [Patescibacteria group bacterium]|nr:Trp family transcriptional regulator [Patescibacteria group bacterium]